MKEIVFKEVITILSYFKEDLIMKIPSKVFKKLRELAGDSEGEIYIDPEKSIEEQNISEESKDIISLIYYIYIAKEDEKNEILKLWNDNENKYQEILKEKYNTENLFKNKTKENKEND